MGKAAEKLPVGLTEPARRALERFEAQREKFARRTQNYSLNILVWGPNPKSGSPAAKKRIEIRDELRKQGHNAMFSEDLPVKPCETHLSQKAREFAQAQAADLIVIMVEGAPGALGEMHDFCGNPELAPKIYVLIPHVYSDGYSAKGVIQDLSDGYGGVCWYKACDLEQCNVLTKAVRRAEARRNILYCQQRGSHEQP
jgi:hypothetical protein